MKVLKMISKYAFTDIQKYQCLAVFGFDLETTTETETGWKLFATETESNKQKPIENFFCNWYRNLLDTGKYQPLFHEVFVPIYCNRKRTEKTAHLLFIISQINIWYWIRKKSICKSSTMILALHHQRSSICRKRDDMLLFRVSQDSPHTVGHETRYLP